jgi:saccharopine dehydrogenase-like NADP-dependent oxidoreductase
MRVLALGGSGGMGRFAVRTAVEMDSIESVVVADLNAEVAETFAREVGPKAQGLGVDVTDTEALRKAMQDVDAVINTVGPFFKFGPPVLRMAIECGCHYLDICDDWEPSLDMLALDAQAREAGISAVIGLGASPGVTNLLALVAMRELDSVEEVYTGWNIGGAVPEEESSQSSVNAAMEHGILQMTGTVRVHRDGAYPMVRPLDKVTVDYPGLGSKTARIFGHPEAITFPHHYPEIRTSLNLVHGMEKDRWIPLSLRALVDWKVLTPRNAARLLGWLEKQQAPASDDDLMDPNELPVVFGLAVGQKNGQKASVGVAFQEVGDFGMGHATGVPLACGLELLAQGRITQRGVFAPESGAIDPEEFFNLLATKEAESAEADGAALVIARSWDPDVG